MSLSFPPCIYGRPAETDDGHVAVRPSWGADVEMNDDDEFEEIDVFAID